MMSNISNFEAASTGAKTLWIGDVEAWMDEAYITSLFAGVSLTNVYKSIGGFSSISQTH